MPRPAASFFPSCLRNISFKVPSASPAGPDGGFPQQNAGLLAQIQAAGTMATPRRSISLDGRRLLQGECKALSRSFIPQWWALLAGCSKRSISEAPTCGFVTNDNARLACRLLHMTQLRLAASPASPEETGLSHSKPCLALLRPTCRQKKKQETNEALP